MVRRHMTIILQNRKSHGEKQWLSKGIEYNLDQHLCLSLLTNFNFSFKKFFISCHFSNFQTYPASCHSFSHLLAQFLLQHNWCSRGSSSLLVTFLFHWQDFWKKSLLKFKLLQWNQERMWVTEKRITKLCQNWGSYYMT